MANQSFRQVFVTNNPALLAQGSTVENLAVGQVGILDAKTFVAKTTPTYANTKAIKFVVGTHPLGDLPLLAGVPDNDIYTKLIKGKSIKGFRGKKAKKPQNQIITVGWSGDVSDTDTLSAKPGELKRLYVTLTGSPIDKLYSTQGITRSYFYEARITNDCQDTCVNVDPREIAESLVKQINSDTKINRFVKATKIQACTPELDPATTDTDYIFKLRVCDNHDDVALGLVQSQYPTLKIERVAVEGNLSVYQTVKDANSAPTAFTNAGTTLVPYCSTCPSGYTLIPTGKVYKIVKQDAGDSTALTAVSTAYSIAATGESTTRLAYEFGQSTYLVVSTVALTASGTDVLEFLGDASNSCLLTSPTTVSWVADGTLVKYGKKFRITLGDTECGTNRLTELQAFYDSLVVSVVDASGTCVHTYETTVYSNAVPTGCSFELVKWQKPQAFDGVQWSEVSEGALPDGTTCLVGIKLEVDYVNRITNDVTYGHFAYDADTVHLKASTFDPDYNKPLSYTGDWSVKQIQSVQYPQGFGAYVRELEKKSLSYELRERSFDPVVRELEHFKFQAQPLEYYDEYVLDFEIEYKVGGWSEKEIQSYSVSFFFPTGKGKAFESAMNTYLASAAIDLTPVVL